MSWPPPAPPGAPVPPPGALLAGWPAFAVDVVLKRHAAPYAAVMNPGQRAEFEAAGRAIRAAALLWQDRSTAADGNAETPAAAVGADSARELGTAAAAALLGVSERRVRQLAAGWAGDGLARKAGGGWLLDAAAVRIEARRRRTTAA